MICQRCGADTMGSTGSYFNTDQICFDCDRRERAHPRFEEARRVETEHVQRGDMNFPGIGLPPELAQPAPARTT